jgi:uncharacterized protein (DUF885 family)
MKNSPFYSAWLAALMAAAAAGHLRAAESMEDFIRRYQADAGGTAMFYDLAWSDTQFDRMGRLYRDYEEALKRVDFDPLDEQGRIDYLLLRNKLTEEKAHQALEERWLKEMDELLPFRKALQQLEWARLKMMPVNAQESAEVVAAFPDQIKKLRARIAKGKKAKDGKKSEAEAKTDSSDNDDQKEEAKKDDQPPLKVTPVVARRAADAVDSLRGTLRAWFSYYDGFQPEFSWWLKKPHEEAAKALEEYAKYLREEIAGLKGKDEDPLVGDPIGAEGLADDLAAENIPYTPRELIAIAEREFAWCEGQMKKASGEMGLGDDWKSALAKVKADYAAPGEQAALVTQYARAAIDFVKQHELVTIPPLCEETWHLTMSSPERQKTLPYAAYSRQTMMVAYASDEMKNDDKLMSMRGNNKAFTHIGVAHELIPGHHLQAFMAARNRDYRGIFRTPFFVEGWALYWELRLWDLGYGTTPQERIGMLFWRMHRCARIIVSLRFHLGEMKPKEMIDFLVDRVGHERFGATSEVRRYISGGYSPLYQCSYLLGGMQLRALRDEIVGSGKMTDKQFNDTVLAYNAIPIEFIRAGTLNLPLTRETKASWRFADPPEPMQ